jgi:hypothetical protein
MRGLCSIVLIASCIGCITPYFPELISEQLNLLVVDGSISADGNASVVLSRSIDMNASMLYIPAETGATVTIESSSGKIFSLTEAHEGTYTASDLDVNSEDKYMLHIITSKGDEYRSSDMQIFHTPPIDSVYWVVSADGNNIEVRVNAKDQNENATGFYLWDCLETYQYHSALHSSYKFLGLKAVQRLPEEEVYTCWLDELVPSTFFDTHILTEPTIAGAVVQVIPQFSKKISVRYSILVRQRAINEEEYFFRSQLKMSTNNTGSLYAVTPGSIVGNVRSVTNPDEYVLGYFTAKEVTTRRFFINYNELPGKFKLQNKQLCDTEVTCSIDAEILNSGQTNCVNKNTLSENVPITGITTNNAGEQVGFMFTSPQCGDCRAWGGTTTKPPFW